MSNDVITSGEENEENEENDAHSAKRICSVQCLLQSYNVQQVFTHLTTKLYVYLTKTDIG